MVSVINTLSDALLNMLAEERGHSMIQNSGAVSQQFLTNLQLLQQQMAATQQQISSGTKISQASDAPNSVGDVLQLESDLGRVNQVTSNLNLVSGEVNSAESALETATHIAGSSVEYRGTRRREPRCQRRAAPHFRSRSGRSCLRWLAPARLSSTGLMCSAAISRRRLPTKWISPIRMAWIAWSPPSPRALIQDASGITFAVSKTAQDIFDHRNPRRQPGQRQCLRRGE